MNSPFLRYVKAGTFALILWAVCLLTPTLAQTDARDLSQAVEAIEQLELLRHSLASSLEDSTLPATAETFKEVCRPVGMQAQQLSQKYGWQVKQISFKYRNPDHAPDTLHSRVALAHFERDSELMGFWDRETIKGQGGSRYYRRITVEPSCLACHGAKAMRPAFIQEKYPQDLAFDFKPGDLRGMYAVFLPDIQAALQN
jgi:hypothetical protein